MSNLGNADDSSTLYARNPEMNEQYLLGVRPAGKVPPRRALALAVTLALAFWGSAALATNKVAENESPQPTNRETAQPPKGGGEELPSKAGTEVWLDIDRASIKPNVVRPSAGDDKRAVTIGSGTQGQNRGVWKAPAGVDVASPQSGEEANFRIEGHLGQNRGINDRNDAGAKPFVPGGGAALERLDLGDVVIEAGVKGARMSANEASANGALKNASTLPGEDGKLPGTATPAAGIPVGLEGGPGSVRVSARTDEHGAFDFAKLPAGKYKLVIDGQASRSVSVGEEGKVGGQLMRGSDGSVSIFDRWGNLHSAATPTGMGGDAIFDRWGNRTAAEKNADVKPGAGAPTDANEGAKNSDSPVGMFGSGIGAGPMSPGGPLSAGNPMGPGAGPMGAGGPMGPAAGPGPMSPGAGPMGAGGPMAPLAGFAGASARRRRAGFAPAAAECLD